MEEMTKRINHKMKAVDIVDETNYFRHPTIQMVLVKETKKRDKYIIGIVEENDYSKPYIVRPHKAKTVTDSIHYKTADDLDECIEGYVLFCITNGYTLSFISMPLLISVWEYIEVYCSQMDYAIAGVKEFLLCCQQAGVTKGIVSYYDDIDHEDLYAIYLSDMFLDYNILIIQTVGDDNIILGYQNHINDMLVYTVFIADCETNTIMYMEHHSLLDSAVTDFMRMFYDLSIKYYQETEKSIRDTIHHFKVFLTDNEGKISVWTDKTHK